MAGLSIKCPICGGEARVRTSERPTLLTIKATLHCHQCGELKADFYGQIANVRRAVYVDCPESNQWEKPEKELIREQKLKPKTNAQRIAELKGENMSLFDEVAPEKKH